MAKPTILLIGGLDPQGCAGIAADIQTASQHDCHALALMTALTEQTSRGLVSMGAVTAEKILAQYRGIRADFDIQAVKIGLIPNLEVAYGIKTILQELKRVPVVYDPVLAATSGGVNVPDAVQDFIMTELLPEIYLFTPNLDELAQLTGQVELHETAVQTISRQTQTACLVKGGHRDSAFASDLFVNGDVLFYLYQHKHAISNVRGTGCVLAASIACHLAVGQDLRDAVVLAKAYISRGIRLSQQAGPYRVFYHDNKPVVLDDLSRLCYRAEQVGRRFDFPACPSRLGIYPVVDSFDWVKKLVDIGIETIQLRVKALDTATITQQIRQAVDYLQGKSVAFFVNDYWQLAIEQGVYGVHLGQEDLHDASLEQIADAGLRLGVSTHSWWELARSLAVNPSYIALGPIYETRSKKMPFSPQGKQRVEQWVELLKGQYPLVAIGGIDLMRAQQLKQTGVGSVAMISAIIKAADYRQVTRSLLACWG